MTKITYKDKRMCYFYYVRLSSPGSPHVGYTVVFKNDVTEETVMKYMNDVVDAGGRLTQSYDFFLNVRIVLVAEDSSYVELIVGFLRCHSRGASPTFEQKQYRR
jgi:hypothetical protein